MSKRQRPITNEKVDARVQRTRVQLREALLELVQRKPIGEITVRELTAHANVSYPTFFRHYPDLANLLEDVADEFIRDLLSATLPLFENADIRAASVTLAQFINERRPLSYALLAGGAGGSVSQGFVRKALETAESLSDIRFRDLPSGLGVFYTVSALIALLVWWLNSSGDVSPDKMGELIDRLVFSPAMENDDL